MKDLNSVNVNRYTQCIYEEAIKIVYTLMALFFTNWSWRSNIIMHIYEFHPNSIKNSDNQYIVQSKIKNIEIIYKIWKNIQ